MKIAFLWAHESLGLYANAPFNDLYKLVGHNNGNLAFIHALRTQIEGAFVFCRWGFDVAALRDVDVVVIPCANQLGKHTDLKVSGEKLLALGKPVIAIGLGAQAADMDTDIELSDGTLSWVKAIDSLRPSGASNIYTRGPFTSEQLKKFGIPDAVVGGCPSHFINPEPNLGHRIHQRWIAQPLPRAISVAGGHEGWARLRTIEQQLINLIHDPFFPGQYVVQSMAAMIHISRDDFDAMEPAKLAGIHQYLLPHYTLKEFQTWCRGYAKSFYDAVAWMDSLRRFDLSIGPRYHGTALAIQAERMGVTIALDSRTEEMCIQTGVPMLRSVDLAGKPLTRETLKKAIQFDPAAYETQRTERVKNFLAFLEANGLVPAKYLYRLADGK